MPIIKLQQKNYLNIYNIYNMSKSKQQQEITDHGEEFDPANIDSQYREGSGDDSSDSGSDGGDLSDEEKIVIKNYQPTAIDNPHMNKVYHDNQYTKLDQKMCLSKVQACENQEMVKEKKNKDKAQRATVEQVLDPRTLLILKKMLNNGTLTEINGCLSTGKEANVYYGVSETSQGKKQYAIKIYKTSILVFKDRERYVQGQFRFRRGYCSSNPRKMVKMWAEKELRNLNRIEGNMPCPSPLLVKSNVLVMDFIGADGVPAPKLKDINKTTQQFSHIYLELLTDMRILYQECKLIHADLSQYNLLYYHHQVYVIDVSQSVEHDHPQALNFLRRDICNVNDFFDRKGVKVFTQQQVFVFIVSLDVAKGKEKEFLEELIDEYDEDNSARDEVFNKIKIHQNLSSIPLEKVEKELFDRQNSQQDDYHHTMTGIKVSKSKEQEENAMKSIKESKKEGESSDSDSDSDDSEQGDKQGEENSEKEKKEGGKQKYQGLSKVQRKHKVKEEKREKRKEKMSKKTKKKLMKQ